MGIRVHEWSFAYLVDDLGAVGLAVVVQGDRLVAVAAGTVLLQSRSVIRSLRSAISWLTCQFRATTYVIRETGDISDIKSARVSLLTKSVSWFQPPHAPWPTFGWYQVKRAPVYALDAKAVELTGTAYDEPARARAAKAAVRANIVPMTRVFHRGLTVRGVQPGEPSLTSERSLYSRHHLPSFALEHAPYASSKTV